MSTSSRANPPGQLGGVGGRVTRPEFPKHGGHAPRLGAPPCAHKVSCRGAPAAEGRNRETPPHPRGLAEPHSLLTTQQKWGQSEARFGTRSRSAHGGHNSVG